MTDVKKPGPKPLDVDDLPGSARAALEQLEAIRVQIEIVRKDLASLLHRRRQWAARAKRSGATARHIAEVLGVRQGQVWADIDAGGATLPPRP